MCINKHQRLASETTFLLGLTQVEEMLISAVMPIIFIYRLPHGQYGYSGHVINLHQDVLSFASTLKARPTMLAFRLVIVCPTSMYRDTVNSQKLQKINEFLLLFVWSTVAQPRGSKVVSNNCSSRGPANEAK